MVAQEYFIWHHKILVHERNFAESLGQADVRLSLSMNSCVEMNLDSGRAIWATYGYLNMLNIQSFWKTPCLLPLVMFCLIMNSNMKSMT